MDVKKVALQLEGSAREALIAEYSQNPEQALALFKSMEQVIDFRVMYRVQELEAKLNATTSDFLLVEVLPKKDPDAPKFSGYATVTQRMLRKSDIHSVEVGPDGFASIAFRGEKLATVTSFATIQEALGFTPLPPA